MTHPMEEGYLLPVFRIHCLSSIQRMQLPFNNCTSPHLQDKLGIQIERSEAQECQG